MLLQESGRFADARDRLVNFVKAPANYPLTLQALIRLGISQVQLKEGQAALNTLGPLVDRDKAIADQVYLWMARAATLLIPEPGQKALYDKAVARVVDYYRQAAARLETQGDSDPAVKQRHGEMLLEFVDTLLQFNQPALGRQSVRRHQSEKLAARPARRSGPTAGDRPAPGRRLQRL